MFAVADNGLRNEESTIEEGQDVPGTQVNLRTVQSEERPTLKQQGRYRRFDAIYHLQSTLWYRGKQFIDDWLTLVSEADVH